MAWVKDELLKLGIRPSKQRGQNFLSSIQDARLLVREAGVLKGQRVIEIGPGLGTLTQALLEAGAIVEAVEIENRFVDFLNKKFESFKDQFSVTICDFRDYDIAKSDQIAKVVSNVPYVLSTEAVMWIIRHRKIVSDASILVQREFAERVSANSGCKSYGSLSVYVQIFAKARLGVFVPGNSFYPSAEVVSQQLHLSFPSPYFDTIDDIVFFEEVLRASFATRRKMLINCLHAKNFISSKTEGQDILKTLGLNEKARAEDLAISEFISLAKNLVRKTS